MRVRPNDASLLCALALAACGPGKASVLGTETGSSGGTGGASSSATSTSGTTGTATATTGTGTSTSTSTTGPSSTTSMSTTGAASTTGGSTGCDLMPVGGTGTGTGGMEVNPYGPCETDEDCVTDYNLQWCIPGECVMNESGSVCMPPWEECPVPDVDAANCPSFPEWMDCSEETKSHPEFDFCAQAYPVPTGEVCELPPPLEIAYCSILCNPPKEPCPEGMVCAGLACVWPP